MRAAGALCLFLCLLARDAVARDYDELGKLEKQAVDEALAAQGLSPDAAPDGKRIGRVHVFTHDVFTEDDLFFQIPLAGLPWRHLRFLHRPTRDWAIRRELLFQPGDLYRGEIIAEATRKLWDPSLSSVVVILPVKAAEPGSVDVAVVTRDVWSLRLNTDFELQQGQLTWFTGSLAENNLFGWRKQAAAVFEMDQGRMSLGPTYVDPNIAGTRLTFSASVRAIYERRIGTLEAGAFEGWSFSSALNYPFWSLARRWAASLGFSHADSVARSFVGSQLRRVSFICPPPSDPRGDACAEATGVPWMYRTRSTGLQGAVWRAFGGDVLQRVGVGYDFSVVRPSFTDDFPPDAQLRAQFAARYFPRSELTSGLFARYQVFTPRYLVYRDLNTFDLRENVRLGPSLDAALTRAEPLLGSERAWNGASASVAWTLAAGGGLQIASLGGSARLEGGRVVDRSASASLYAASPVLVRALRLVASASGSAISDFTYASFLGLGGESGLRGYTIGDFLGRGARVITHLEARSMAFSVASLRVGGLLFHDAGHAADSVSALRLHHDVGAGLRVLIPQLNAYVLRADWAFALQHTARTRAGWPGRFTVGFQQIF